MIGRAPVALVGVALALVGLVGCSGGSDERSPSATRGPEEVRAEILGTVKVMEDQGRSEQADAFRDGSVDEDEYRQAIGKLRSCIEEKGYSFSEPILSPVTGLNYEFVYNVNGRDEPTAAEEFRQCEAQYWQPLAMLYFETHTQRMDPQLKNAVLQCMAQKGYPGDEAGTNLAEISPIAGDDDSTRVVARECATTEAQRLYPELPSVSVFD